MTRRRGDGEIGEASWAMLLVWTGLMLTAWGLALGAGYGISVAVRWALRVLAP